jgi:hypothetical protein
MQNHYNKASVQEQACAALWNLSIGNSYCPAHHR